MDDERLLIETARWLGTHALSAFLVLLPCIIVAVGACTLLATRQLLPRLRGGLTRQQLLLAAGATGFVALLAAAALFAAIAAQLRGGGALGRADEALTLALRASIDIEVLRWFAYVTHLGDRATLWALGIAIALLLWWRRHRLYALGWVLACGGNALLNPALKHVFARVRPLHEHGLVTETSWSFPSGHASSSLVGYGMLAYLALRLAPQRWHLPAMLGAAALAVTVGSSRVFLQVHYASDVLAGFASGTAWLLVAIIGVELGRHHGARR